MDSPGESFLPAEPTPEEIRLVARRKVARLVIFSVIMLAAVLAVHYSPAGRFLSSVEHWKQFISDWGLAGHFLFAGSIVILLAMGLPRLALAGLAGVLLGFVEGFAIAQIGTVLGSWAAFSFARWGGRDWARRKANRFPRLTRYLAHPTVSGVFLARQLPLPALVQNAVLGMSDVRSSVFLLGTFLGYLPTNAAVSLLGSALGKSDPGKSILQVITAVCLLGVIAFVLIRQARRKNPASCETHERS